MLSIEVIIILINEQENYIYYDDNCAYEQAFFLMSLPQTYLTPALSNQMFYIFDLNLTQIARIRPIFAYPCATEPCAFCVQIFLLTDYKFGMNDRNYICLKTT